MKLSFDNEFQEFNHLVKYKHDILDMKQKTVFIGPSHKESFDFNEIFS